MAKELDIARTESELNELFTESSAFRNSSEFSAMMRFIARRSRIAPFNSYLLYIQKPDIDFAASRSEWNAAGRTVREGARPLIILKPFGPVEFVYDASDTEGTSGYWNSKGFVPESEVASIIGNMEAVGMILAHHDARELKNRFKIPIPFRQASHDVSGRRMVGLGQEAGTQDLPSFFGGLVREYARHLLGHAGSWSVEINGKAYSICDRDRSNIEKYEMEWEAECVAYLVCNRAGLEYGAAEDLAHYLNSATGQPRGQPRLNLFAVLAAANKILKGFSLPKGAELPADGLQLLLF
jgi:hypothetical protein